VNVAAWLALFVTVSEYEPALNPVGNCPNALWSVNDTRDSVVVAKTTFGARPAGLKLAPVMVIRLFVVFTTVLLMAMAALASGAWSTSIDGSANKAIRDVESMLKVSFWCRKSITVSVRCKGLVGQKQKSPPRQLLPHGAVRAAGDCVDDDSRGAADRGMASDR
jgi:hypothetical protein